MTLQAQPPRHAQRAAGAPNETGCAARRRLCRRRRSAWAPASATRRRRLRSRPAIPGGKRRPPRKRRATRPTAFRTPRGWRIVFLPLDVYPGRGQIGRPGDESGQTVTGQIVLADQGLDVVERFLGLSDGVARMASLGTSDARRAGNEDHRLPAAANRHGPREPRSVRAVGGPVVVGCGLPRVLQRGGGHVVPPAADGDGAGRRVRGPRCRCPCWPGNWAGERLVVWASGPLPFGAGETPAPPGFVNVPKKEMSR